MDESLTTATVTYVKKGVPPRISQEMLKKAEEHTIDQLSPTILRLPKYRVLPPMYYESLPPELHSMVMAVDDAILHHSDAIRGGLCRSRDHPCRPCYHCLQAGLE
ncbi:hypothetical protein KEM54_001495 [Ascosphaera aggregata]|nr:hypothetical protein KEM54_001495 [Ascosphaera aggregata]